MNAKEFIKDNWQTMSDVELAKYLGYTHYHIQKLRCQLRLRRYDLKVVDKEFIAKVCEYYANDISIVKIAKIFGKPPNIISKMITKYWFRLKKSEDTITLVMDSKANYYQI